MIAIPMWSDPPECPILPRGAVHVWRARLNQPVSETPAPGAPEALTRPVSTDQMEPALSADQRMKAGRIANETQRRRYIVSQGILRDILAFYLGLTPHQVSFRYGPHGKPEIDGHAGPDPIRFNMSHSRDIAVYAVSRGRRIGVDVEFVRTDSNTELVAARFFSDEENRNLARTPPELQREAFFRLWSCKEAYAKAVGRGLSLPLDQFTVGPDATDQAQLLSVRGDPEEAARWSLHEFSADEKCPGTVAVEGRVSASGAPSAGVSDAGRVSASASGVGRAPSAGVHNLSFWQWRPMALCFSPDGK